MNVREPEGTGDGARTLDVSNLPTFAFGNRSPMWWGTMCLVAIESTVFALTIMSYFYLRSHASAWPMSRFAPDLLWGTLNTALMIGSVVPNHLAKLASERLDLRATRRWMLVCMVFALAFLVLRGFEFSALNTRWDENAYGSAVWMLLGLHTTHLVTDFYDSGVLTALTFSDRMADKRFVDVSENAGYWYFVVISWLPIYAVIYWGARY